MRNESLYFWLLYYKLGISTLHLSLPPALFLFLLFLCKPIQKCKPMNLHNFTKRHQFIFITLLMKLYKIVKLFSIFLLTLNSNYEWKKKILITKKAHSYTGRIERERAQHTKTGYFIRKVMSLIHFFFLLNSCFSTPIALSRLNATHLNIPTIKKQLINENLPKKYFFSSFSSSVLLQQSVNLVCREKCLYSKTHDT